MEQEYTCLGNENSLQFRSDPTSGVHNELSISATATWCCRDHISIRKHQTVGSPRSRCRCKLSIAVARRKSPALRKRQKRILVTGSRVCGRNVVQSCITHTIHVISLGDLCRCTTCVSVRSTRQLKCVLTTAHKNPKSRQTRSLHEIVLLIRDEFEHRWLNFLPSIRPKPLGRTINYCKQDRVHEINSS